MQYIFLGIPEPVRTINIVNQTTNWVIFNWTAVCSLPLNDSSHGTRYYVEVLKKYNMSCSTSTCQKMNLSITQKHHFCNYYNETQFNYTFQDHDTPCHELLLKVVAQNGPENTPNSGNPTCQKFYRYNGKSQY